jgi:hypothetical protein
MTEHFFAANIMTSLISQPPTSLQPSGRAVAVLSSTPTENFSNNEVLVLLALLDGVLSEFMSPDSMYLAIGKAKNICYNAGVSEEDFKNAMQKIMVVWNNKRKNNPLAILF